jgi:hypothetical protein
MEILDSRYRGNDTEATRAEDYAQRANKIAVSCTERSLNVPPGIRRTGSDLWISLMPEER